MFRWEDLTGISTDIKEDDDYTYSPLSSLDVGLASIVGNLMEATFKFLTSRRRYGDRTITREHYLLFVDGEEVLRIGVDYKDMSKLVRSLERHIADSHIPRLLERWQQGETVTVAHFSFEPELVRRLGVTVKWADIREIISFGGKITCILKNGERVDLSSPLAYEINQHMVTPLMKAVHRASKA